MDLWLLSRHNCLWSVLQRHQPIRRKAAQASTNQKEGYTVINQSEEGRHRPQQIRSAAQMSTHRKGCPICWKRCAVTLFLQTAWFEMESFDLAQAGLELGVKLVLETRLVPNLWSFCLSLLSTRITDTHHAPLFICLRFTKKAIFQLLIACGHLPSCDLI